MKRIYSSQKINFGATPPEIRMYIEQLRNGDETVWLVIYGQNQDRFLNYVRTLDKSNKISDTAVENLVEKAYDKFLIALRREDLKNQHDLKKFFFTTLYNLTMDFFRKWEKVPISYGDDDWLKRIKQENDAEIDAEKEVVYNFLDAALPTLRPKYQKVLHLKYYEEPPLDLHEIAEKLGETYDNIKAIHMRAKNRLREIMSNKILQAK